MVDPRTHGCLEPEVLAAYVDHGLSLAERARVETHLTSCPPCTALLAGVVRTAAEIASALPDAAESVEASPLVSWQTAAGAAVAAAAVLAVLAAPSLLGPWFERDAGLVSLAGDVGEHRFVLGRLAGGFPHAPLDDASAGGQDADASGTDRVLLTAGRIREFVGESATPSELHTLGVRQLLQRRYDDAAELLLAASRQQPSNARYLNDVATVQLERARRGLRPDDLPRALAAADRALRLDPSLKEAWFNRALAMSALQLTDQAKAAWTEYLRRDSASPWAGEARQRLAELAKPTAAAAWAEIETRLLRHIDAASADAAVRAQTTEARDYIETRLLIDWADAVLAGRDASTQLNGAHVMSEAMLRVSGDAIYSDAINAIHRLDKPSTRAFAESLQRYSRARQFFDRDDFANAKTALNEVRAALERSRNPLLVMADVHLGAVTFVEGNYAQADRLLQSAHADAMSRQYLYAAGRASWFRGLIAVAQGRLGDAQMYYEDTLATFDRMNDVEQRSAAHNLMAALNFALGDKAAEWHHRGIALAGVESSRSARLRHSVLASAAISVRAEYPETALAIFESVVAEAFRSGRPALIVDAIAHRAAALQTLGRIAEAGKAITDARSYLTQVADPSFRNVLELPVLAADSDLTRATDPRSAARSAQRAIDTITSRGDRSRLPPFLLRLAKANIAGGNFAAAERALLAGIQAFEETHGKAAGMPPIAALDESWELFEAAAHLAIRRGDFERAFDMVERGRAPASRLQTMSLAEAQGAQRADKAVIALMQFDDELAIWVIRRDGNSVIRRPLSKADARRIIARQQGEILLATNQPIASATIYDEIVRPLWSHLAGVRHLVFVPDLTYQDASFAALWDRTRQRYLIEQFTLSAAPSVTLASMAARPASAPNSILVLASDDDATAASNIASNYRNANIAVGANATPGRLLKNTHAVLHVSVPAYRNTTYPSLSRLILSDEPGRKHSGALPAREIATQQMVTTQLVVLDEARTEDDYQSAGTFDLATAFLAAGVPAVLGTLPAAHERESRELMLGFHRQLAPQMQAAEALAQVQRDALQQNGRRLGAWTALVIYGSDR